MLLLLLLVIILVTPFIPNSLFWLSWVSFNPVLLSFQLFLVFSSIKLFYSKNVYESLLWSFLSIFTLTVGLFIYQLDVFACFLLVSETVVIFFILTFIIHINHTNLATQGKKSLLFIFLVFLVGSFINFFYYNSDGFSYYVSWYTSQISSYNDLLSQYIYLYTLNSYLTLIVGSWLLLLTFFLVLVVTTAGNSNSISTNTFNYFLKKQNLWKQWGSSPFLKFFK